MQQPLLHKNNPEQFSCSKERIYSILQPIIDNTMRIIQSPYPKEEQGIQRTGWGGDGL